MAVLARAAPKRGSGRAARADAAAARRRSGPALFAEALVAAATHTMFTDMPASLQLAEKADEVADGLGDDRLLILSRGLLCFAYSYAGQPQRARPLGAEAVQRARQLGDDVLLGRSLVLYATAVGGAASGPLFAEAFACTERSGDLGMELHLHNNAGWAALEMGDIPGARAHMEAAIRAAEDSTEPIANSCRGVLSAYAASGHSGKINCPAGRQGDNCPGRTR